MATKAQTKSRVTEKKAKTKSRVTEKKAKASKPRRRIPDEIVLDFDSLTWSETAQMEEVTGKVIGDLLTESGPTSLGTMAFIWLRLRESDPDITLDDVGSLTLSETRVVEPPKDRTQKTGSKS